MILDILDVIVALIAIFVFISIAMAKGSALSSELLNLSWENILVIIGVVLTIGLQITQVVPSVPSWVPAVIAILIEAVSNAQKKVAVARANLQARK